MLIVRANKVSLVLGLITATLCVAFGFIYIFGDVRKGDLVSFLVIELALFLGSVLLLMDYKLRRFMIKENVCCYRNMFGLCRFFAVQTIKAVHIYTKGMHRFVELTDEQGRVLVRMERDMVGMNELLNFLWKADIR